MSNYRTRSAGYTLIELMIVIAIIGIFVSGYDRFVGIYFQRFLQEKHIIDSGMETRRISAAFLGDVRSAGRINTKPRSLSKQVFRMTLRNGQKVEYKLSNGILIRNDENRTGNGSSTTLATGLKDVRLRFEPSAKNVRSIIMICSYKKPSRKTLEFVAGFQP